VTIGMTQPVERRIASSTSTIRPIPNAMSQLFRRGVAVGEVVAALQRIDDDRDGERGGQPVPPHDPVPEALRDRKDQEAQ
jgi:hypothetical protein